MIELKFKFKFMLEITIASVNNGSQGNEVIKMH